MKTWTFVTNHGLVLLHIFHNRQCTTRDIASAVNITERSVHRILQDLEEEGYIQRERTGRGTTYRINTGLKLRHDMTRNVDVGDLLELLLSHSRSPIRNT